MSPVRIELAPEIRDDFDRILEHLRAHDVADPAGRLQEILEGISVLALNPLIGRAARQYLRELVIGRESRGYVALYRFVSEIDTVFILAIRSRREAGHQD